MICLSPEMPKQLPKADSKEITVGIAEDDVSIRDSLIKLVGDEAGFCCLGAYASGEEALKRLPKTSGSIVPGTNPRDEPGHQTDRARGGNPPAVVHRLREQGNCR